MKAKFYLIAAAACAALAACSKNEVAPVDVDQEITYQTIETKAASKMELGKKFYSWAFFLPQSQTWVANSPDAQEYIHQSLIEYVSGSNAWKNASATYFWPKQGKLTFFAVSDNTSAGCTIADGDAYLNCTKTDGVAIGNFSVTNNMNKDLLVAKISADQTENTTHTGLWEKGVPTVFYHILSAIEVKAQTTADYYSSGAEIKIQNIEFDDVIVKGSYKQGISTSNTPLDGTWTLSDLKSNLTITNVESAALTTTPASLAQTYSILMPQKFETEEAKAKIVYTIKTNYTGTPVIETVTETISLKTLFNNTESMWKPGRKYVLTIKIGLNEILWDPSVEPWDDKDFNYSI